MGKGLSSFTTLTSTDPAAIAIIRVAGPAFETFARAHLEFASGENLARFHAGEVRRAVLRDTDGEPIDDLVVSVRSAVRDSDVWLHLHGGPWITRRCSELLTASGLIQMPPEGASIFPACTPLEAAIAEHLPAMLTLDGVRWLCSQAQALPRIVQRLAAAADRHRHLAREACACLAERTYVYDWYTRPLRIALMGPPNAGKSTLFNRLVGDAVSITSPEPGTTRDWVEAPGELGGFPVTWIDTAGIFESTDQLDAAGMEATKAAISSADLNVAVLDATRSQHFIADLNSGPERTINMIVFNKIDTCAKTTRIELESIDVKSTICANVSALNGTGIDRFRQILLRVAGRDRPQIGRPAVFTRSQVERTCAAITCHGRNALADMILSAID